MYNRNDSANSLTNTRRELPLNTLPDKLKTRWPIRNPNPVPRRYATLNDSEIKRTPSFRHSNGILSVPMGTEEGNETMIN